MNRAIPSLLADYGRAYGVKIGVSADPRRALKRMWCALSAKERPIARRAVERALSLRGDRKSRPSPDAMLAARDAARERLAQAAKRSSKARARLRKLKANQEATCSE